CEAWINSHVSLARRRTSAEPTIPVCPATHTRLPRRLQTARSASVEVIPAGLQHDGAHVMLDHFGDQRLQGHGVGPADPGLCLRGVSEEEIDLVGAEVARVDLDDLLSRAGIEALFVNALANPLYRPVDYRKRAFHEFAHGMGLAGRQHIVVGLVLLKDPP